MTTPAPAATASAQASHALIVDALGRRIAGGTLAEGERVTVAQLEEEQLVHILGRAAGRYVFAVARNRDPRPVRARRGRRVRNRPSG